LTGAPPTSPSDPSAKTGDQPTLTGTVHEISMVTGLAAYPYLKQMTERLTNKVKTSKNIKINLYPITNNFFGKDITVVGLLTGADIIAQLKDRPLGERLLLPACVLRSDEAVFLDDLTLEQVEKALQVPIYIVKSSGYDLVKALLN
jgi:NifB/MoaA-like Fe-S oxidoreductase